MADDAAVKAALWLAEMEVNELRRFLPFVVAANAVVLFLDPGPSLGGLMIAVAGAVLLIFPATLIATAHYTEWVVDRVVADAETFVSQNSPPNKRSPLGHAIRATLMPLVAYWIGCLIAVDIMVPAGIQATRTADQLLVMGFSASAAGITIAQLWRQRSWPRIADATGITPAAVMEEDGYEWHWLWGWQLN